MVETDTIISRGGRLRPQSTPTSVDGTREALRANTARAFVRSFVRSFVRDRRRRDDRGATRDASAAGDDEDERAIESVDRWHPS